MVTLKVERAEAFVAAPPEGVRLFLVYGSDQGAITERVRLLEQHALRRGRGDSVLRIGSDELSADPGRIVDEARSASLFGGEPVVALRVLDGRHNVIGAVTPLIEAPPEASWLIVEAGELAPTSALRKAFEGAKAAAALPTYALAGKDLSGFIAAAAEEAGIAVDDDAVELLAENLAGDRLASRGELEKLFLYVAESRRVTLEDAEAIVGETTEAETSHAIDSALIGDSEALETGLNRLRAESASFGGLGALALRHLIQLQTLRHAMDSGSPASRVVEQARPPIHFRRRPRIEAALGRWPAEALAAARRRVDRAILLSRQQPALEAAAISEALHRLALEARRMKRSES
jgi:DNA polymerase-3 subunit delta